jgi:hypothetical protein
VIVDKSKLIFKLDISHINRLVTSDISYYIIGYLNNIPPVPTAEKLGRGGALHGKDF